MRHLPGVRFHIGSTLHETVDLLDRGFVEIGDRHVRRVFARVRFQSGAAGRAFAGLVEPGQSVRRLHAHPQSMRIGLPEPVRTAQLHREGGQGDIRQLGVEILGPPLIHLAEEAQGDVEILQRPPASPGHAFLQAQIVPPDFPGHRNGSEQTQ